MVRALVDEEPATTWRLAAAQAACIVRRKQRRQRPEDRPQDLLERGTGQVVDVSGAVPHQPWLGRHRCETSVERLKTHAIAAAQGFGGIPDLASQSVRF